MFTSRLNLLKPGLHFERKSTPYTQTILRTWGAFSRPPMPIYAVVIAQVPSINTPTIRRLLRADAGLSLAKAGFTLRTQIYGVNADHFAHLGRVFSATNADLRRRVRSGAE